MIVKKRFLYFILISCLMAIATMGFMYFSHDVQKLKDSYPHHVIKSDEIQYVFKKEVPRHWVKLEKISTFAQGAIVLSEDWSFYSHEGIDHDQLKTALMDVISGGKVRGASTITQQLVKNVFLSSERTLWRKIHEMILAYKVEKTISKNRILEVYLNSIEFGPGIFGIRRASTHYFSSPPFELTPRQGAFLAMLLPSPRRYYVSFRKKKLTPFALERVDSILEKMRMGKIITPAQYELEKYSRFWWEQ